MAETAFSSIKRMFGEYTSAIRFQNMVKEMTMKVSLYNLFRKMNKMNGNNLRKTSYATEQKLQVVLRIKLEIQYIKCILGITQNIHNFPSNKSICGNHL